MFLQKVIFNPIPYHPLIDPETGELNTKREFRNWQPNQNKIWHVILFAKKIFYLLDKEITNVINEDKTINDPLVNPIQTKSEESNETELGSHYENTMKFFHTNFKEYQAKVEESIKECHAKLYDNPEENSLDLHSIRFHPWNSDEHEQLRRKLLKGFDLVEEFNNLTILNGQEDELTNSSNKTNGLSFMTKGQIFSKD